jgi:hypothetical protein
LAFVLGLLGAAGQFVINLIRANEQKGQKGRKRAERHKKNMLRLET